MKNNLQSMLYDYSRHNETKEIKNLISQAQNLNISLDLLYENGVYFDFAIKKHNKELVDILLNYYNKQHNFDTPEYNIGKYKLKELLKDKIVNWPKHQPITADIENLLEEYIGEEWEDSTDHDSELEDLSDFINSDTSTNTDDNHSEEIVDDGNVILDLTSGNLIKLEQQLSGCDMEVH